MSAELALQGLLAMNNQSPELLADGYEVEAILYARPAPDGRTTEYQVRKVGSHGTSPSSLAHVAQIDPALDGGQAALEAYLNDLAASSAPTQTNGIPVPTSSHDVNSIPVPSTSTAYPVTDPLLAAPSPVTGSLRNGSARIFGDGSPAEGRRKKRLRYSESSMNLPTIADLAGVDKLNALLAKFDNKADEDSEDEDRNARSSSAPLASSTKRSRFGGRNTPRALPAPVPVQRSAALQNAAERVRRHTARYVCQMCGRDFTRKANLTSHVQTHLNIRPFQCERCPRSFVRRHELKRHIALHDASADGQVRWGGMRPKKVGDDEGQHDAGPNERIVEGAVAAAEAMEALDDQHEQAIAAVVAAEKMRV